MLGRETVPLPFPLSINVDPPPRPSDLTKGQIRSYRIIRQDWATGQERLIQLWNDEKRGQKLRQFPWHHPTQTTNLRFIFEEIIGFRDDTKAGNGGYRYLREARRILGLGSYPTSTGHETIYVFTNTEIAQLVIGFLTYSAIASKEH
jgi:hypothetical protein